MIHPIVKYGDPILETRTKPVEKFDEDFQKLIADMFESMYAAQGVGRDERPALSRARCEFLR